MSEPFSLNGRCVVVTGGAGRIGSAISQAMSDAGARLAVVDIDVTQAERIVGALSQTASFHSCDTSDIEAIPKAVDSLDSELGGIDVWVNCAYPRTNDWGAPADQVTVESWRRNVDLQLNGYCLFAEHIARRMAERGQGSIINVASIYGMVAPDTQVYLGTDILTPSAYPAIKGGVIAHSRYLASYYGRKGVRVNALCPGGVFAEQDERFVQAYSARTALGRMAEAEEIGPPAVFLASDAASYITGAVLPVDGGWTAI